MRQRRGKVKAFKNVYNRKEPFYFKFEDFINNPAVLFNALGKSNHATQTREIKAITDKAERNDAKRNYFPAVDIGKTGYLSIDIDGIAGDQSRIDEIVIKLRQLPQCVAIQESVSGNLVAYFQWMGEAKNFKFIYYKLYLELTLLLGINIDFLPEIGRLRYVSTGVVYHYNKQCVPLTEFVACEKLPYINTTAKVVVRSKTGRKIYASK